MLSMDFCKGFRFYVVVLGHKLSEKEAAITYIKSTSGIIVMSWETVMYVELRIFNFQAEYSSQRNLDTVPWTYGAIMCVLPCKIECHEVHAPVCNCWQHVDVNC
mmetsp:Transcript_23572/g.35306  ORF Transcript_23572/g.35306 Transcript_23572/m.35306 type:complete len:104 (-) Transcript_23572:41-352(-)